MELGLSQRTALVVGASGGIGGAVCSLLVEEGVGRLGLGVRDVGKGTAVAADLGSSGSQVEVVRCDLRDPDSPSTALRQLGSVDLLVMAAGAPVRGEMWAVDDDAWAESIDTKLLGTMRFVRTFIPPMVERGFGRVVMIGGLNGRKPASTGVIGGVINAGLASMTKAVARDVASAGVTVNLVDPNSVRTERWDRRLARIAEETGKPKDEVAKDILKSVPAGRPAPAEDVAGLIVYLLSDRASSITGTAVPVDGGANPSIF